MDRSSDMEVDKAPKSPHQSQTVASRRDSTSPPDASSSSSTAAASTAPQKRNASAVDDSTSTRKTLWKKPRVGTNQLQTPRSKSTIAITPMASLPRNQPEANKENEPEESKDERGTSALRSLMLSSMDLPTQVPDLFAFSQDSTPCQCLDKLCSRGCLSVDYLNNYGWEHKTLLKEKESMDYTTIESEKTDPIRPLTFSGIVPSLENRTRQQTEWFNPDSINWDLDDYMDRQPDLAPKMRSILIDWIVELSEEYKLSPKTFHLAVTLIDKSLACTPSESDGKAEDEDIGFLVPRDLLQCLGCACTWIASKMEETVAPSVDDFVFISDNIYRRDQITDMEMDVCQTLKYRLQHVTPVNFAHELLLASEAGPCNPKMPTGPTFHPVLRHLVNYLLELSRLSYELVAVKPSLVAAAAVFLARATLGIRETEPSKAVDSRGYWTKTLEFYSGYTVEKLKGTVRVLLSYQQEAEASSLKAAFNKYNKAKFMFVSTKTVLNHEDLDLECFISSES